MAQIEYMSSQTESESQEANKSLFFLDYFRQSQESALLSHVYVYVYIYIYICSQKDR